MDTLFGMKLRHTPIWQFWLARIFGKTIKVGNFVFKNWHHALWLIKEA